MEDIALDIHTHLVPIDDAALKTFDGVTWDAAAQTLTMDGHALGLKPLFHPEALIAWLDANRIAKAWISIPPPAYRSSLDAVEAERWTGLMNDGLADIAQRHASRFSAMIYLPVEHPALAVRIADAWSRRGQSLFAMATGAGPNVMLSDAAYAPLWRVLDEAGAFLFLHPGEGADPRADAFYLQNLFGNPTETAIAAAHLVFAGVPQRHPGLAIGLAHGGGATVALAGRFERGFETSRPGVDLTLEPPKAALQRLWADCILHDAAAIGLAAETYGADKLVFGSDWPFPMGLPKPHEQLAGVAPSLRARLMRDNASTLAVIASR